MLRVLLLTICSYHLLNQHSFSFQFPLLDSQEHQLVHSEELAADRTSCARDQVGSTTEKSNFDYAEDIAEHEAVFKSVGFTQIKHWYQPQNFPYRSGKEFLECAVNKNSFP